MRILIVLGNGGHSTEMLELVDLLGPEYEYHYMLTLVDHISEHKIHHPGPLYRVRVPFRKRHDENSVWNFVRALWGQVVVWFTVRPHVILSTGANIAIPVSLLGRLGGSKVIHVETGARVYELSSSGKVMYYLANLFFVQWEELLEKYPKALYAGRLL